MRRIPICGYLWVFVVFVLLWHFTPQAAREVRMLVENADATGERGNDVLKGDTAVVRVRVRERREASIFRVSYPYRARAKNTLALERTRGEESGGAGRESTT